MLWVYLVFTYIICIHTLIRHFSSIMRHASFLFVFVLPMRFWSQHFTFSEKIFFNFSVILNDIGNLLEFDKMAQPFVRIAAVSGFSALCLQGYSGYRKNLLFQFILKVVTNIKNYFKGLRLILQNRIRYKKTNAIIF